MNIDQRINEIYFERTLDQLGLIEMRDFIREKNPAKDLPYHNTAHMEGVAAIADRLYNAESLVRGVFNTKEHRILITAALWHDYGHSGGTTSDEYNIERAVSEMGHWHHTTKHSEETYLHYPTVLKDTVKKAEALIRVTEFKDGGFPYEPKSLSEKILRDADLLYTFSSNTGEIVWGLYHELGKAGKLSLYDTPASRRTFIEGQYQFLKSVTFYTETARMVHGSPGDLVQVMINTQADYFNSQHNR